MCFNASNKYCISGFIIISQFHLVFSVSISSTYPGQLVGWLVGQSFSDTSDFHSVGVYGPLQSIRRPQDVICFPKATYDQQLSDFNSKCILQYVFFPKCIFTKCTRHTHFLRFASFILTKMMIFFPLDIHFSF